MKWKNLNSFKYELSQDQRGGAEGGGTRVTQKQEMTLQWVLWHHTWSLLAPNYLTLRLPLMRSWVSDSALFGQRKETVKRLTLKERWLNSI